MIGHSLPWAYGKILEMLPKLMHPCEIIIMIIGSRAKAKLLSETADGKPKEGQVLHTLTWVVRPMFCMVLNI